MSNIGTRFAHGLLIGFGIVFPLLILLGIGVVVFYVIDADDAITYSDWEAYSEEAKIVIGESRRVVRDDTLVVLGSLENQGTDTWDRIVVEVELFDEKGVFIDECSEVIEGNLSPKEKENFKITCSKCKDLGDETVKSHEIKVKTADYAFLDDEDV